MEASCWSLEIEGTLLGDAIVLSVFMVIKLTRTIMQLTTSLHNPLQVLHTWY